MTGKQKIVFSEVKVTTPSSIAKEFLLDAEGKLQKKSGGQLVDGSIKKIELNGVQELADHINGLGLNQCLIYGVPKGADEGRLCSEQNKPKILSARRFTRRGQEKKKKPKVITRKRENFEYPEGVSVFMLDIDCLKGVDELSIEDIREKLTRTCPALKKAPMVILPSSSSNIYNEKKKLIGIKGLRILVIIKNGTDIPRAGISFMQRLWLEGFGTIAISKSGAMLSRTLVDGAVWQPERLDFCGGAKCIPPLEQRKPEPLVLNPDAEPFDTEKELPDLEPEDLKEYERIVAEAKENAKPEALETREEYIEDRIDEATGGVDKVDPEIKQMLRERIERTLQDSVLHPDDVIVMSNGKEVKVKQLLLKKDHYDGKYCCDPLEPDYNGNSQAAWIKVKTDKPFIYSHAHGGRKFHISEQERSDIDKANDEYAIIPIGSKVCIIKECVDPVTGYKDPLFLSVTDFKTLLENRFTIYQNAEGKLVRKQLAEVWLKSKDRKEYKGLKFDPSEKVGKDYYNLFQGLYGKGKPGIWVKFGEHMLEVICGGEEEYYNYLFAWLARIVQDPGGEKPGVAFVMRGLEGTGKGTFVQVVGKIFGPHFLQINNQSQVTGRFNSHFKDVILLFVDEGFWGGSRAAEGVLKGMVTEKTIPMEPKGKDIVKLANHMNIIIASNSNWVVPAGMEARRFFVVDVSDKYMQDSEYFARINEEMDNGGFEAFLYDLQNYDLSGVNLRDFPRTKALFDQIENSFDPVQAYWFERLNEGTMPEEETIEFKSDFYLHAWPERNHKQDLYNHYLDFCSKIRRGSSSTKSQFYKQLKSLCPELSTVRVSVNVNKKIGYLKLPALDVCRKSFENAVKMRVDWDDPMGDDQEAIAEIKKHGFNLEKGGEPEPMEI